MNKAKQVLISNQHLRTKCLVYQKIIGFYPLEALHISLKKRTMIIKKRAAFNFNCGFVYRKQ